MNNLLRGLVAGLTAKQLGGGCFSTILIFLFVWWLLGYCDRTEARTVDHPQVYKEYKVSDTRPVTHRTR